MVGFVGGGSEFFSDFEADAPVGAGDEDDGFGVGGGGCHDGRFWHALAGNCSIVEGWVKRSFDLNEVSSAFAVLPSPLVLFVRTS